MYPCDSEIFFAVNLESESTVILKSEITLMLLSSDWAPYKQADVRVETQ